MSREEKMKVLFITTCYPSKDLPQYCVFLEQQAQALTKSGFITDVLLLCEDKTNFFEEEIYNGIHIIRLGFSAGKKTDILLPTCLSKSDAQKIEQVIRSDYDAVSLHFGGLKILRSLTAICKKKDIPLILHFHGLNVWYEFYEKRKWLYNYFRLQKKHLYSKIDAMVGVSNKVVSRFTDKIKKVPAYTVYNGVNLDLFKFTDREFSKTEPLKILIVANLIKLKGHDYLITAVSKAVEKGIDIKLTIAGRGPLLDDLKDLAMNLGISECVRFTGYIEYEKIADLMQENDVFIMPSYYEALGCVYLEAMSSGMITVGVFGQGIDEIIDDGKNGFLVEPKNVDAIVEVMEKLNNKNSKELESISKAAVDTAQKYSWKNSASALLEVYKALEENK